jgi:hypothetical protein
MVISVIAFKLRILLTLYGLYLPPYWDYSIGIRLPSGPTAYFLAFFSILALKFDQAGSIVDRHPKASITSPPPKSQAAKFNARVLKKLQAAVDNNPASRPALPLISLLSSRSSP